MEEGHLLKACLDASYGPSNCLTTSGAQRHGHERLDPGILVDVFRIRSLVKVARETLLEEACQGL